MTGLAGPWGCNRPEFSGQRLRLPRGNWGTPSIAVNLRVVCLILGEMAIRQLSRALRGWLPTRAFHGGNPNRWREGLFTTAITSWTFRRLRPTTELGLRGWNLVGVSCVRQVLSAHRQSARRQSGVVRFVREEGCPFVFKARLAPQSSVQRCPDRSDGRLSSPSSHWTSAVKSRRMFSPEHTTPCRCCLTSSQTRQAQSQLRLGYPSAAPCTQGAYPDTHQIRTAARTR